VPPNIVHTRSFLPYNSPKLNPGRHIFEGYISHPTRGHKRVTEFRLYWRHLLVTNKIRSVNTKTWVTSVSRSVFVCAGIRRRQGLLAAGNIVVQSGLITLLFYWQPQTAEGFWPYNIQFKGSTFRLAVT